MPKENRIKNMIRAAENAQDTFPWDAITAALDISDHERERIWLVLTDENVADYLWTEEELRTLQAVIKRWKNVSPAVRLVVFLLMQRVALMDVDDIIKFGSPIVARSTAVSGYKRRS